jgi:hypothetical protein
MEMSHFDNKMADAEMVVPDNEIEEDMQVHDDGEEVHVDGEDDMANLHAMLCHFQATVNLSKLKEDYLDLNALVNDSKVQLCQNGKKEHTKLT